MNKPNTRALAVLVLLTVVAMLAAVTSLHHHDSSTRDACRLCRVGHMPALQTSASAVVPAPAVVMWHEPAVAVHPDLDPVLATGPSRAPPSA
ncbi:MAG TPA: hypothetical protein VGQ11_08815 [Candidatus Acidoferrales bacterium]|nr:hypothetical protein [Candidatus Acidoferrales bacterium]